MTRFVRWIAGPVLVVAAGALSAGASTGASGNRIFRGIERDARGRVGDVLTVLRPVAESLRALERGETLEGAELSSLVDAIDRALPLLATAEREIEASLAAGSLAVQQPGAVLPRGLTASKVARGLRNALRTSARDLQRAGDLADDNALDLNRRHTNTFRKRVLSAADVLELALVLVIGDVPDGVALDERDPGATADCTLRPSRGVPLAARREDRSGAKSKRGLRRVEPRSKSRGGGETDEYTAIRAVGKEAGGFLLRETLLELAGDVDATVEIGRFSDRAKVAAAAGDGEFQCIEVSTVGSAASEAFVSACGRFVSGATPGFQGYLATPAGAVGNLFLPGVTRAELRVELRSGTLTAFLRDADTADAFQQIASVTAPGGPLTFSLGAAGLGPNDEVGFDDLFVQARADSE